MYKKYIKRLIDFLVSIILFILLLPLFLLITILIRVDSKGNPIFKQERLGKNGKVFKIYKFRTMVENAEKKGMGIKTYEGDPRITKIGYYLRKYSLDELPQIINVIIGNMSFVGPRPPVPYHPKIFSEYTSFERKRFDVKPGITGYAQVKGRNLVTWDERIPLDVKYSERISFIFDMKIIYLTIIQVIKQEGIHSGKNNIDK